MKKIYEKPIVEIIGVNFSHLLVTVSGKDSSTSDGTVIGDGGDDDGDVIPAAKGMFWDELDEI